MQLLFRSIGRRELRAVNPTSRARLAERGGIIQEYGVYLLLAVLVFCGLYTMFASSTQGQGVSDLHNDLVTLSGRVKGSYSGQYEDVSTATLIQAGMFNGLGSFSSGSGVETVSLGGGYITVSPTMVRTPDDALQYKLTNLPDSACVPLVAGLQLGAAVVTVNSYIAKSPQLIFTPGNVQCSGDANTITFSIL